MTTPKTPGKISSLGKMQAALSLNGWHFGVVTAPVYVPDPDKGYRGAVKAEPGWVIEARNWEDGQGGGTYDLRAFTVQFTEDGKYLATNTKGNYPFTQGESLTNLLKNVEFYSKAAQQERQAQRAAEADADLRKEAAKVAETYAAAEAARVAALQEAVTYLREEFGLAENQSVVLLATATAAETPLTAYFNAKTDADRAGRGWATGKSWVRGTYVDGVLVDKN